jgi:hypothetical protein
VDPVPDPLLLKKYDSARNQTRISGSVARNSDHQTTEGVLKKIHKYVGLEDLTALVLGYNAVLSAESQPMFWGNILPPFSVLKHKPINKP